ncbi:MAG TPA: hypothetical protein VF692_04940 [Pyrinomonadaceae bacterium]
MNEEFTAKQATIDELTMPTADLNPSPVAAQAEDWGMTNPLGKPPNGLKNDGDGWRMPEPIFRVSDGFCPLKSGGKAQSSERAAQPAAVKRSRTTSDEPLANLYAPPEKEARDDVSQRTMHNLSLSDLSDLPDSLDLKTPAPEIAPVASKIAAPQPNISEEFTVKQSPPQTPPEKKPRSETARLFFAALGVLAMLSFAAGFLALVYFLFFYKAAE